MQNFPPGLYDLLQTKELDERLKKAGIWEDSIFEKLDLSEIPHRLSVLVAREIARFVSESLHGFSDEQWESRMSEFLISSNRVTEILKQLRPVKSAALVEIKQSAFSNQSIRPDTPLAMSALLTGSSRSPALRSQLIKEIASCDRADWLVSFIKYAGLVPMLPTLEQFVNTPSIDGLPKLRIATTSYMGATDVKAIEALLKLPNTEVRVSFDTKRTRLHAKAYLFHRKSGFSSAYIGSANISKAALDEGLEWTAKISQFENEFLWKHASGTFESHWEDKTEFVPLQKEDLKKFGEAILQERGQNQQEVHKTFFDLRPFGFQEVILQDIEAERLAGKTKHLIIAATGTGKTMVAAFDYKRYCDQKGGKPRLLFVAHRQEILEQAKSTFQQVLTDGSFGSLVFGGTELYQTDHLFCTVQSWNSRAFDRFASHHFDYVVLDEAHHASAESYQRLIQHVQPKSLLGLTATPERMDGKDIRDDFAGSFTHEIRLPEAIDRALLSPFHYYGIPDHPEIDFSNVEWRRGAYDIEQLRAQLEENEKRARWVMQQVDRYVANTTNVRGIGFCVSVAHAKFMAEFCQKNGIQAISLSADSSQEARSTAKSKLEKFEINFIFTVDLYNEGVDLPFVDTVLFLRPTESLTVFLQQLGRGLRLHKEKAHLAVLDFIAPQSQRFSYAKRFQALTSRPDIRIDRQLENNSPYVPSGCLIHLEKQSKDYVLQNIKAAAAALRGDRLLQELRRLRTTHNRTLNLLELMDALHLDHPDELLKHGLPGLLQEKAMGNTVNATLEAYSDELIKGCRKLLTLDDSSLFADFRKALSSKDETNLLAKALLNATIWKSKKPGNGSLEESHSFLSENSGLNQDLIEILAWLEANRTPLKRQSVAGVDAINLHGSYTRDQILLALGLGSFENPRPSREGVLHVPDRKLDVFFADIQKSDDDYSPSTMYEDFAVTDKLFHWQSQSTTSERSNTGQRYIKHAEQGYKPLLFIRHKKKLENGITSPFFFAGPLKYQRHEGSNPMSITWELEYPLPAKVLNWARLGV